jgi:hypothetical protein
VSSKRARRRKGCAGKIAHTSKAAATKAVPGTRAITPGRPDKVEAYRCDFCGAWHVGHRPGPGRRYRSTSSGGTGR